MLLNVVVGSLAKLSFRLVVLGLQECCHVQLVRKRNKPRHSTQRRHILTMLP